MKRRDFLKTTATGSALTVLGTQDAFAQRESKTLPPQAIGMLYDSTLCIGCKACVAACKRANDRPPEVAEEHKVWNIGTWDSAKDISGDTLNVIKVYQNGDMTKAQKDREIDGYAFMKRHCLHCVDPS
jgi:Fe-S-cluster-containing dehydrogenase component